MVRKFLFVLTACLFFACNTAKNQQQKGHENPPNVIFIIADDIGYADFSCYGATAIQTPQVDKLSQEGLRFTNAHSTAATCTPSRYSLFTGQYNWRRKDTGIATGDAGMVIRPEQPTIASLFQSKGYVTAAIGKWHLGLGDTQGAQNWNGFITPGPSDIGFSHSYIMAATGDRVPCVWIENQRVANYDAQFPIAVSYDKPFEGEPLGKTHPHLVTKQKPSLNHGHDQAIVNGISRIGYMKGGGKALWQDENIADTITVKAIQFIEQHKEKPFFLYVGTNDIHVPRYPHSRFVGKSGLGLRGDALLQFDWTVGQIIETLQKNHLLENTLIILSSDNGPVIDDGYQDQSEEMLGEHRPWGDFHKRGGKYSNFTAGTRIPFIVSWKGKIARGISDALVSQVDLYASMAALLNSDLPQGVAPDSQNQLQTLLGKDTKGRDYVISSAGALSIYDGTWKYIVPNQKVHYNKLTQTPLGNSPKEQLYHIKEDISEMKNIATEHPEQVQRLKALLKVETEKGYMR
ncbi:sulfatase family protein [Capnocytophaga canimorsus]|uniref:sulfatase family protein n=1 Tax=Capnocytophaga canimorsus TaxID=28188 RepID=UPI0038599C3B